jgi:hypothetical protein
MAYIGHSSIQQGIKQRGASTAVAPSGMLARSAFLAIFAALAVLILSDGGAQAPGAGSALVAAKSDRLAAPRAVVAVSAETSGGVLHDAAARTTTVALGAVVPLSPDSPMSASPR